MAHSLMVCILDNTVFDGEFMKRARPGFAWKHEDASQMMLEELVNSNGINGAWCLMQMYLQKMSSR